MHTTIWKFIIPGNNRDFVPFEDIQMPSGATIRFVSEVDGIGYLWAEVDPESPTVKRRIYITGTGKTLSQYYFKYIGTIIQEDGGVYHLYDGGEII